MKLLLLSLCSPICVCAILCAQPLNGNYTVGGTSPDYATLQDVANALKARGVSGPVFMNIRPGIYMRQGSAGVVMRLDTVVAGVSPTNRITFQPDVASGGNPSNIILRVDCDIHTDPGYDREAVYLGTDYTTLRNLVFQDVDSLDVPCASLVRVTLVVSDNPTIEGLRIDGCTFMGTPYYTQGQQFGTDFGVYQAGGLVSARITNSHFTNLMRAISFNVSSDPPGDSLMVEGNHFDHLYGGFTGAGNALGTAAEIRCAHPIIQHNVVQQSSGSIALQSIFPSSGIISGNYIAANYPYGEIVVTPPSAGPDRTDSFMISNNITLGPGPFQVRTRNTKLLHNTIICSGGSAGLWMNAPGCVAINNILLTYGVTIGYDQIGGTGLTSDHNVFFSTGTYMARGSGGQYYFTFEAYQHATGQDTNSHFTDISFSSDSLGIRLDECQSQNSDLDGIPLGEVPVDFYGARRDSVRPFIGAVEGVRLPYDMFAAPFKSALPGFALSIAAGRFDDASPPGLAVPDFDNHQVVLFHSNGAGRTFSRTGTLSTPFGPTVAQCFDLDHDGNLDLVVGGEANQLKIFWGDGAGGFPSDTTIATTGRVRSIDTGFVSFENFRTIVMTEDNGFLPSTSFLCYVANGNGRHVREIAVSRPLPLPGGGNVTDTIPDPLDDFVAVDLDGNGTQEIVAPSLSVTSGNFYVFVDTTFGVPPWGHHHRYSFRTSPITVASSIVAGDFDGDGDNDLITTGRSDGFCVLLKNEGGFHFTEDTIQTTAARGIAALDYDNDGDLDVVTINRPLDSLGITVFLNDGTGHFAEKKNCYFPFATGWPNGVVAADFDGDTKTDIAVVSRTTGGYDSLFVLYNLGGFNSTTNVPHHEAEEIPEGFTLFQNYPNPFNPSTRIRYALPARDHVSIRIYNILGQEVAVLLDEILPAGEHEVMWNGCNASGASAGSGVYFYMLEAGSASQTKRLLLLR